MRTWQSAQILKWCCVALVVGSVAAGCAQRRTTDDETGKAPDETHAGHVHELMTDDSDGESQQIEEKTIEVESDVPPSAATWDNAVAFRDQVVANIESHGWTDPVTAFNDGFRPMLGSNHWVNAEFVNDGRTFDPTAPEFIMVQNDKVVGTMFLAPSDVSPPPEPPGAPHIRWHYHTYDMNICFHNGIASGVASVTGEPTCPNGGEASRTSPLMSHVWIVDLEDPFTDDMTAYIGR